MASSNASDHLDQNDSGCVAANGTFARRRAFRSFALVVALFVGGVVDAEPLIFVDRLVLDDAGPDGLIFIGDLVVLEERLIVSAFDNVEGDLLLELSRDADTGAVERRSAIGGTELSALAADVAFDIGFSARFDANERYVFVPVDAVDEACLAAGNRGCARFGIAGVAISESGLVARTLLRTDAFTSSVLFASDGAVLYGFGGGRITSYRVDDDGKLTETGSLEVLDRIDAQVLSPDGRRLLLLLNLDDDVSAVATIELDAGGTPIRLLAVTSLFATVRSPFGQELFTSRTGDQLVVHTERSAISDSTELTRLSIDENGRASVIDVQPGAELMLPGSTRFANLLGGTPNGRRLFADGSAAATVSFDSQGLLHTYARGDSGALMWLGAEFGGEGGVDGDDLLNLNDLAVSPDGRFVYVLANQAVFFRPDTTSISRLSWFAVDEPGVGRGPAVTIERPVDVDVLAPVSGDVPPAADSAGGGGCSIGSSLGIEWPLWPVFVAMVFGGWRLRSRSGARSPIDSFAYRRSTKRSG